jgi:DNA transposition AAA+ family ATPase
MTQQQKNQIKELLEAYVKRAESQNKAAVQLGLSPALITQVLKNNWQQISDKMWLKIAAGVGIKDIGWAVVNTTNSRILTTFLNDAQENSNVYGIVGEPGSSKSETSKQYVAVNNHAYRIECGEYWNRKMFLSEILTTMGIDNSGYNVGEMMHIIVKELKGKESPVLILDEADKLSDQVLYFFITLYNRLEGHCGIVLLATDHLQKRLAKGLRLNRKGYKEIYSRLGRKFIALKTPSSKDIAQICMANGITDVKAIQDITEDAEGDLRRVKRLVDKHHKKQNESKAPLTQEDAEMISNKVTEEVANG